MYVISCDQNYGKTAFCKKALNRPCSLYNDSSYLLLFKGKELEENKYTYEYTNRRYEI